MSELMEAQFRQTIASASEEELREALVEIVCYYSITHAKQLMERIKARSDKANEIVVTGLTIMATKSLNKKEEFNEQED